MDETMIRAILNLQNTNEKAVIATIIRTEGPTPRERGTKMLIIGKGQTIGTIGGGSAENQIFKRALSLLTADSEIQGEIYRVVINQESDASSLEVCGANMDVLLEPILEDNLWQFAYKLLRESKDIMLMTSLVPPYAKNILDAKGNVLWGQTPAAVMRFADKIQEIYSSKQTEVIGRSDDSGWLLEPVLKTTRLLILGAGYVAREVAYYARPLDFQVTVIDDRAAFALPEFFPGAQAVICSDFAAGIRNYRINCDTYVVIATRSHQTDEECLKDVLNFKAKYVGMLGSSKKITAIAKRLRAKGYTDRDLGRLRAPVGLKINAQTPAEIAISILAEIISVRREVNKTRTSTN